MAEKFEIPAVLDKDLLALLEHYGLKESFQAGELACESCLQTLTWDNLGALLVRNESLVLFCNLSECIESATNKGE